ncbi:ribosome small subunit-dependent GTPase A [uncultured Dialister sp.]|uniref:ribosome small subunit-dependent GTPase A n=1 Tax=uncultured Dialister sp. TaxID=278064 RepID=UPI0025D16A52|nr:ribosome small subunit-dependent GTPase A [uncultured Dialister sp.]
MKGLILKNQNGYFTISGEKGTLCLCRSRGALKRKTNILVGDYVDFETDKGSEAVITSVYPRKAVLHRPPVANIDQLVLVCSIRTPDLNYYLMDKMVVLAENSGIEPLLVISKADLDAEEADVAVKYYRSAGYQSCAVSVKDYSGIEQMQDYFSGHIIAFSGPSGVGKSSLLNILLGRDCFISGKISCQTGRGKNTTRHAELIQSSRGYYLMDTPGYTHLSTESVHETDLSFLFRDFRSYLGHCRFNNCIHVNEPDCAVRSAVESGIIQKERYESYKRLLEEIKANRRR